MCPLRRFDAHRDQSESRAVCGQSLYRVSTLLPCSGSTSPERRCDHWIAFQRPRVPWNWGKSRVHPQCWQLALLFRQGLYWTAHSLVHLVLPVAMRQLPALAACEAAPALCRAPHPSLAHDRNPGERALALAWQANPRLPMPPCWQSRVVPRVNACAGSELEWTKYSAQLARPAQRSQCARLPVLGQVPCIDDLD